MGGNPPNKKDFFPSTMDVHSLRSSYRNFTLVNLLGRLSPGANIRRGMGGEILYEKMYYA